MTEEQKKHEEQSSEPEKEPIEESMFPDELPPAELNHIIHTFGVQAMIHLGRLPNPVDEQPEINLNMAKFNIDLLEILQDKTKGNLTEAEEKLLEEMLHVLRLTYVDTEKKS